MNDSDLDSTVNNIVKYAHLSEEKAQSFKDAFIQYYKDNKISVFYDNLEQCYLISPKGFDYDYALVYFGIDSKGSIWNKLEGRYSDEDWLYVDKVVFYNTKQKWTKSNLFSSVKSDVRTTSRNTIVTETFDVSLKNTDVINLAKIIEGDYSVRLYSVYDNYTTADLKASWKESQKAVIFLELLLLEK